MPNKTGSYERLQCLLEHLRRIKPVVVAFSGGSDSSFLLWACTRELLSADVVAVTFQSATVPAWEIASAQEISRRLGVRHIIYPGPEMQNESFLANDLLRCYYCKRERFNFLLQQPPLLPGAAIIEGAVVDDLDDYRPGMRATREAGILSPLLEAGISKADIAILAAEYDLDFTGRPSEACLATRIARGCSIELGWLEMLHRAEQSIRTLGFDQVRVRWDGEQARLEFAAVDLERAQASRVLIESAMHNCGIELISPAYSVYHNIGRGGAARE